MSFENYGALKEEIRSFLWDRADIVERIPSFVKLAETEANRLLKTREMNATQRFTYSSDTTAIPCDGGNIYSVTLNGDDIGPKRDLDYVSPEQFASIAPHGLDARPRFYTVQNGRIMFAPQGSAGATGVILYDGAFCPLKHDKDCNWLLHEHPDIYLCGALKWGKAWLISDDQDWSTPFYGAIKAANLKTPRVQLNTTLRADEVTRLGRRHGFNIRTGAYR